MNIRVDLNTPIKDGTEVVFRSPVDCSQITGLILYYPENGNTASKEFAFADAHGNDVGNIDHLFAENAVVKVILDLDANMAFVQNADTNAYLEGRFKNLENNLQSCAGAILCEATGEVINIADASNGTLGGLTLYGKTVQNGTPTPENPVSLESAGASGSIGVTVAGENLFGGDALADKLVEVASAPKDKNAGAVTIIGTNVASNPVLLKGVFKENTQYTFVLYGRNSVETGDATNITVSYMDCTTVDVRFPTGSGERYAVHTTTAGKTVSHIFCRYQSGNAILYYDKCGIFEGVLTEADFEPYKGQTLTASTPNGLHGTESVTDEIDFARGVLVQRFKEGVLNGDESWHMSTTDYGDVTYFYASFSDLIKNNGDNMGTIKSDVFIESYGNNTIEHIRVHNMNGRIMLFIKTNRLNDASIAGLSAWLAEHPVNIVYRLATPIETPLTAEELAQYAALRTNYPNTTVFNDANAGMKMDYVADTKTYIDNKFAELAAAIVNNA